MRVGLQEWVDEWYSIKKYQATYNNSIYPIRDPKFCPKIDNIPLLSPPLIKKKRGQTKQGRRRDNDEGRKKRVKGRNTTVSCSHCTGIGHNMSGCPQLGKQPY